MQAPREQVIAQAKALLPEIQRAIDRGDMERAARLLLKAWMAVELLSRTLV